MKLKYNSRLGSIGAFAEKSAKRLALPSILGLSILCFTLMAAPPQGDKGRRAKSDPNEYFRNWLKEDVAYIISPEEKAIFSRLTTVEEKEQFIEQFWLRRSPDPTRSENEYKAEHYRRIQYANDWFHSGEAGWKTDRGRIYIMYGPPTEVTRYGGGQYERSYNEGGGLTTTYPFERWIYRHLEGLGDNVELEFVDDSLAGEYRLAMSPHEKDALLNVPNAGLTLEESLGLAPKSDRIRNLYAANPQSSAFKSTGFRDSVFERMQQYFTLQRPPEIRFKDLKEVVTASVQYNMVPFRVRADWLFLGGESVLVPITIKIDNNQLTYRESLGIQRATVNVYGSVRSLQGVIAAEFEEVLTADYTPETVAYKSFQNSVYQKQVVLKPGLYRLDLAVKDVDGGKTGSLQTRLQIPRFASENLALSPVILSKKVEELQRNAAAPGLFEVGDLKIIPEVGDSFTVRDRFFFYLQVYNAQLDPSSATPSLAVSYSVRSTGNGSIVFSQEDDQGKLIHYHSPQRVVLLGRVPLQGWAAGKYQIRIEIRDRLSGGKASTTASFDVTTPGLTTSK